MIQNAAEFSRAFVEWIVFTDGQRDVHSPQLRQRIIIRLVGKNPAPIYEDTYVFAEAEFKTAAALASSMLSSRYSFLIS